MQGGGAGAGRFAKRGGRRWSLGSHGHSQRLRFRRQLLCRRTSIGRAAGHLQMPELPKRTNCAVHINDLEISEYTCLPLANLHQPHQTACAFLQRVN